MAYSYIIDEGRKTLIVQYSGEVNLVDRTAALKDGLVKLRKLGYRRIMVDLRESRMTLEPYEALEFSEKLARSKELQHARTAFLIRRNDDSNSFVEIFAGNRGYVYNAFDDETQAWSWLLEK